jgi:hypothetical protein
LTRQFEYILKTFHGVAEGIGVGESIGSSGVGGVGVSITSGEGDIRGDGDTPGEGDTFGDGDLLGEGETLGDGLGETVGLTDGVGVGEKACSEFCRDTEAAKIPDNRNNVKQTTKVVVLNIKTSLGKKHKFIIRGA